MTDRFITVFFQPFRKPFDKRAKLGAGLLTPHLLLIGNAPTDNIFDSVAGKVVFTGYLTNLHAVSKMSQTDFSNGFHDQHLLLILLSLIESREYRGRCWGRTI